jgi:hypothetical protein
MALLEYQTSLAQLVRAFKGDDPPKHVPLTAGERGYLSDLAVNPAFHFTVKVQRSWCAGRAAKAAYLTLSILPPGKRHLLLEEWVDSGGGTHSFIGAESGAFLDFIANRLLEPSHELTICRMEQATLRSSEGALRFLRPEPSRLDHPGCLLRRGRYAGVVHFHGEPEQVLNALMKREQHPAISSPITTLLFGPGFDRLYTKASVGDLALYDRLQSPASVGKLLEESFDRQTMLRLLEDGVLEYAEPANVHQNLCAVDCQSRAFL